MSLYFIWNYSSEERESIYDGLISGLQQMISISEMEEVVFWTSGYQKDCDRLVDALRRFRLGNQHPEYFQPWHRVRRRNDKLSHINYQRKDLRRRLATIGPNKPLKR